MNNRFFLGAVAALSIVSANAERLLDSADNCLVVDNEPMVFGSMVSNKAWTTAEQQTAGLGLYRFFGYTVDAKPVVLSTDFQIESAAYKNGTYYIESTANADTDAAVKLHGHLIAYEPDLDIMSEIAPITNIHNLAGSIAYNPADNKMYCFFANEWTESYTEFGTFDETTATSTFIRSYYNDIITMAALAFDRNGQGYALNVKGELYRLGAANESGAASAATSNSVILGDALAMPFKESFDGGTCQHTWFMGAAWDTFTAGNDPKTQDADGTSGLISFCCYSTNVAKGTVSTIVSPAIAVGGQQAYFNFSVYHYSGTFATEDSLTPCAIVADGSVQTLGDPIMRDNGTTGWKEYSYPLSGNVVCVALKGYSDYGYNIHVDRIAVSTEQSGVSTVEIADNTLVTVYNLSGARVAERMQRSDVSTLAPGCYIVRSATATEKVIVR